MLVTRLSDAGTRWESKTGTQPGWLINARPRCTPPLLPPQGSDRCLWSNHCVVWSILLVDASIALLSLVAGHLALKLCSFCFGNWLYKTVVPVSFRGFPFQWKGPGWVPRCFAGSWGRVQSGLHELVAEGSAVFVDAGAVLGTPKFAALGNW